MGSNTTNYNLYKPAIGEQDWGADVNTNFDTIDTQMKASADAIVSNDADIATNVAAIALNTTHSSSDGSDHTYIDQDVTSGSAPTFTADNFSDGGTNVIITTTQETNFEAAYTHVSSDGSDHTYIDQSVVSGASPTFDGANITGVDAANVDIADSGALITATDVEGALAEHRGLINTNTTHSGTTHDYSYISGNDAATDVTGAQLEELTDGSTTSLHTHAGIGTDEAVAVDALATPGYLGAAANDGVLRVTLTDGLTYTDGGDFVTIGLDVNYADISGNDAGTDVSAAELEELTDGSTTTLHAHAGVGTDELVGIDSGATAGYIGAAANDGVIRTTTPLSYTDGGDFVTITLDSTASFDSTGTWQFARVELDADTCYLDRDGSNNMTFTDAVTGTKTLAELSSGGAAATRSTFTNATLSSGVLTITHSLGLSAPYSLDVTIFDNTGAKIMPDSLVGTTNAIEVDLTSYGTLTGTWGYVYVA